VAVSHSLLVIIYHLLRDNQEDHDLGPHFFDKLDSQRQRTSAVRRLEALGDICHLRREEGGSCLVDCLPESRLLVPSGWPLGCFLMPFFPLFPLLPLSSYFRRNP
jgi:hypothetical protein